MNAGRGHQTLRKAAQTLQKEVGGNKAHRLRA